MAANQKTKLTRQPHFSVMVALVFAVAITSYIGYRYVASHAASPTGGVVIDQNNAPVAGVRINDCNGNSVLTNGNGRYEFNFPLNTKYCTQITGVPAGYTNNPVGFRNRPEHANDSKYANQIFGYNCYHNYTACGDGSGVHPGGQDCGQGTALPTTCVTLVWDLAAEGTLDFRITKLPTGGGGNPPGGGGGNPGGGNPGGGNPGGGKSSSGGTKSGSSSSPSGSTTPSGGAAVSAPSNFTANANAVGVILSWSLSSGGSGEITYLIDRSTDQQDWTPVTSNISGATYVDSEAGFSTQYYYRIQAADTSGNASDYAAAQVMTGNFSPNAGGDNVSLTSDDGVVTAAIPASALNGDAACAVVEQGVNDQPANSSTASKTPIVVGPYQLICRDAEGNVLDSLKGTVAIEAKISATLIGKYKGFSGVVSDQDTAAWKAADASKYDSKAKIVKFNINGIETFAITAKKKANVSLYIKVGLAILIVGGLVFVFIKRKDQIIEWFYRR